MTSLTSLNFVKRTAGMIGILAASAAVVLPVAAQMRPPESLPTNPTTPAPMTPEPATQPPAAQSPERLAPTPGTANTPGTVTPTTPGATTPTTRPANPNAATPSSNPAAAAATGNIIDVASASGSFKTLISALNEAELSEVLEGPGPFTVFAPTDAAFAKLPAGTVEELLKPENRATLVKILKYHVVAGDYPANQLAAGEMPTESGDSVTVSVENGSVKVDDATVTQSDITATNGVIHAIDHVNLPPR